MDIFHFILGPIRGVLVWFDTVVYDRIPDLYKLMLYLANVDVVSNNVPIQGLIQRIYILVGVFMLFKLSFSILNYIVNPDAFSDQSKGFSNLVKRVMIAIVLLVSIPWIFKQFYVVQSQIIKSGILPRLVLGEAVASSDMKYTKKKGSSTNNELEKVIESSAKDVEFLLFGPFYSLNYQASDLTDCKPDPKNPSKHIFGTKDMAESKKCLDAVAKLMDTDDTIIAQDVNIRDFFRNTNDGGEDQRNFSQFQDLASWTLSNGQFAINYNPIISTLCGGYLVFLLLSFCIDIAGRIFRLLFLQILSPIAVISSIDPTSSGDRLKEWAKECFKVWISLFLRMLIIFLIIQLVRVITNTIYSNSFQINGYSNSNGIPAWIYIFLILGIFNAAGKIPELIEKATGIKFSGELQLNPFKALSGNVGVVGMSGAVLGTVGGAFSGGLAGLTTSLNNGHKLPRSLLSGAGAVVTGGVTGFASGGKAGGTKGWASGLQSGGRIARRMDVREATGGIQGIRGMAIDRARDVVGAPTTYESMENRAKRFDDVSDAIKTMSDRATDQLSKKSNAWKEVQAQREIYAQQLKNGRDSRGNRYTENDYVRDLNAAYQQEQRLIAGYIDSNGKNMGGGQTQNQDEVLEMNRKALKKVVKDSKVREFDSSTGKFGKILELDANNIQTRWSDIGSDVSGSSKVFKSSAEHEALSIRSSEGYNDARDRDQAIHSTRLDAHQKH